MWSGDVRRVDIIYFLGRMGHVGQPHLIRLHHLAAAAACGVYLRGNTQPAFTKSKSYSSGASTSNMLRQWITCRAVDANDAVLINNLSPKASPNPPSLEKSRNAAVFCRDDEFGGSARVPRNSWDGNLQIRRHYSHPSFRKSFDDSRKKRQKESGGRKAAAAPIYKPMAGPNCSLCGKTFRPEKMHSHMKSCRGLRSLTKTASTSNKTTSSKSTTTPTSDKDSASTYLLTH
ncbi:uncharacterized protein LOC111456325 [Cucurbita moschata]|uniref:Uncharacterized protein LOC111456325 n=1 Tax=Cucurbita moschata TaxID=3662 RepID=A0A6J1GPF9_CUCMO|nr:uncharacterized protein LOC111456325 [Cucurbita moschata]